DDAFHLRMLREQRETVSRLRRAAPAGGVSRLRGTITPGTPAVGALMTLNVALSSCSNPVFRTGRVRSVGTRVIIIADTTNPSDGFTQADYEGLAETFDTLVYPAVTGSFGTPGDLDGNGRVIAFYTTAINAMTPPSSNSYVGGLFHSRDLLGAAQCPTSNLGEMFYLLAPDPSGTINGNQRSVAFVRRVTVSALGHEFQHLVNASRRLNAGYNLEQVWLNEGLSHVAEELIFYQASGFAPGQNLSASSISDPNDEDDFFEFMDSNFGRFRQWLMRPDTSGPFRDNPSTLAGRGSVWSFLRYAADRKGGSQPALWNAFVATADTGMANLANRLGTDVGPWFRDWAAATYLDDAVAGAGAAYTQPSWNFRSLYAAIDYTGDTVVDGFQLHTRHLANGVAEAFALSRLGGAGYLRMAVAQNAFAGVTTTPPSGTLMVAVMRTK
ncbi:MAG TPA: hypothetical protein VFS20_03100, partial [Longimicrobium sp.]|nr:hypothetical protein [Longimicrobium sp.]